jgi:hypothetical protein
LRLTESLTEFCAKLRLRAETINIIERQQIARLLIREVLVGTDTIGLTTFRQNDTRSLGVVSPPVTLHPRSLTYAAD